AWIELATDDPLARLIRLPLSGLGAMLGASVDPASIDFGQISVGNDSVPRSFTIANTGGADLIVTSIVPQGPNPQDFMVDQTGPFTVPPGKRQLVNVIFSPAAVGVRAAEVDVKMMGLKTAMVGLTGTGLSATPELTVSPSALDFGAVHTCAPPE